MCIQPLPEGTARVYNVCMDVVDTDICSGHMVRVGCRAETSLLYFNYIKPVEFIWLHSLDSCYKWINTGSKIHFSLVQWLFLCFKRWACGRFLNVHMSLRLLSLTASISKESLLVGKCFKEVSLNSGTKSFLPV